MIKPKSKDYPHNYIKDPNPNKTQQEMWDIIDGWTQESVFEQKEQEHSIDFIVPLPPLKYKEKFLKGLFFSQSVDTIVERWPKIKNLFFPIANSMFTGYPQSEHAD